MLTHPDPPKESKRLLPMFERVEPVVLSHSALDDWKKCPRKFFLSWVLGYKPRTTPPYFVFGSAYHKFREILQREYDRKRDPQHNAQEARANIDSESHFKTAFAAALEIYNKGFPKGPPPGRWEFMDNARLAKSCYFAWERWKQERISARIEVLNSELPFNITYAGNNRTNGRYDELIRWNGALWVRDFKTSSQPQVFFERGTDPNDQVSRYLKSLSDLSGEIVRGVVFEVLFNDKTKGPEIYSVTSSRTQSQLENWERDQQFIHAMVDAARENEVYPMYEPSCNFCDYHIVCRSGNERAMEQKLKTEFAHRPYDNMAPG